MKINTILLMVALLWSSCNAQIDSDATNKKLDTMTPEQKAGYSYGVLLADNLKKQGMDELDPQMIVQGMKDIFQGETPQMTMEEANAAFQSYATSIQAKEGEKYIKEGQEFLAQNGARPEVITLPSGLQYEIIKEGTGPKPTTTDKVKTHYHGTLIDGTVFDSSVDRGEPISFGVTQVIAGWTEALQLMPVGSKWKLYIPSDLAYGANPRPGGAIKPNMALIFDIELLGIE